MILRMARKKSGWSSSFNSCNNNSGHREQKNSCNNKRSVSLLKFLLSSFFRYHIAVKSKLIYDYYSIYISLFLWHFFVGCVAAMTANVADCTSNNYRSAHIDGWNCDWPLGSEQGDSDARRRPTTRVCCRKAVSSVRTERHLVQKIIFMQKVNQTDAHYWIRVCGRVWYRLYDEEKGQPMERDSNIIASAILVRFYALRRMRAGYVYYVTPSRHCCYASTSTDTDHWAPFMM